MNVMKQLCGFQLYMDVGYLSVCDSRTKDFNQINRTLVQYRGLLYEICSQSFTFVIMIVHQCKIRYQDLKNINKRLVEHSSSQYEHGCIPDNAVRTRIKTTSGELKLKAGERHSQTHIAVKGVTKHQKKKNLKVNINEHLCSSKVVDSVTTSRLPSAATECSSP